MDTDILDLIFEREPPDEVSLCEMVSQKFGLELTLDQAEEYMEYAEEVCSCHYEELGDDGYCAIDP